MSDTTKRPYDVAKKLADGLVNRLDDSCLRIEIGGSVRRQSAQCGDIELLAIQRGRDLDDVLAMWLAAGRIRHVEAGPKKLKRWGPKLKSFVFDTSAALPVQVDLFIQTPETWGVNMLIRTGAAGFAHRMVTPLGTNTRDGFPGLMPAGLKSKEARIWNGDVALDTPEEDSIFELWGLDFVPPAKRTDHYMPSARSAIAPAKGTGKAKQEAKQAAADTSGREYKILVGTPSNDVGAMLGLAPVEPDVFWKIPVITQAELDAQDVYVASRQREWDRWAADFQAQQAEKYKGAGI